MEQLAADLLPWTRFALLANFLALAIAAGARVRRAGAAGWWVAAAFSAIAAGLVGVWGLGVLDPALPDWMADASLFLILLFPYLLLRFTASFRDLPRWLETAAAGGVLLALLVTVLRAVVAEAGANTYILVVLAYWVGVSLVSIVSLWKAGSGQPTVARRRMRLMSAATAILAVTLSAVALGGSSPLFQLSWQVTALASAATFGLGFAPPRAVRLSWRRPEEEHLQRATEAVLRATTLDEVAQALLPPTTRIVGGAGAAFLDAAGRVVTTHGQVPEVVSLPSTGAADSGDPTVKQVVPLGEGRGHLIVWTSAYAPFFGRDEVDLLRTMGVVASLALERCELLEHERAERASVERAHQQAEAAGEAANRANRAKSEFVSRMSHELRTPLNAVLGFGQLLELAELAEDDRQAVAHILKAGRHLLALIDDILDLSRIEAGTLAISLEPVHTGELIDDTLQMIRPVAESRSISLDIDSTGCDVYVRTDRQRCRQVLLNLLSNAVKYNHDGGQIEVRCQEISDEALRISVRDSGPGIDSTRLEYLFEPFQRLGAENTDVEGTGLGLALTKQLVERLGGAIGVDTGLGQGATFWIDLPVTQAPDEIHPAVAHAQSEPAASTRDRTLLLVEDNLANLRLIEAMLRQRPGISVLPAMQGNLAIELAREHHPDVIVLDLHLPDLSGREVLYRLRADPRTRDIPVVIASADATPGHVRRLREEGVFDYLTKPLDLQVFLKVVDAALAHHDAH